MQVSNNNLPQRQNPSFQRLIIKNKGNWPEKVLNNYVNQVHLKELAEKFDVIAKLGITRYQSEYSSHGYMFNYGVITVIKDLPEKTLVGRTLKGIRPILHKEHLDNEVHSCMHIKGDGLRFPGTKFDSIKDAIDYALYDMPEYSYSPSGTSVAKNFFKSLDAKIKASADYLNGLSKSFNQKKERAESIAKINGEDITTNLKKLDSQLEKMRQKENKKMKPVYKKLEILNDLQDADWVKPKTPETKDFYDNGKLSERIVEHPSGRVDSFYGYNPLHGCKNDFKSKITIDADGKKTHYTRDPFGRYRIISGLPFCIQ